MGQSGGDTGAVVDGLDVHSVDRGVGAGCGGLVAGRVNVTGPETAWNHVSGIRVHMNGFRTSTRLWVAAAVGSGCCHPPEFQQCQVWADMNEDFLGFVSGLPLLPLLLP